MNPWCPRCGKRLNRDIGQDDITGTGRLITTLTCDNCDYRETASWRPLHRANAAPSRMAAILRQLRES